MSSRCLNVLKNSKALSLLNVSKNSQNLKRSYFNKNTFDLVDSIFHDLDRTKHQINKTIGNFYRDDFFEPFFRRSKAYELPIITNQDGSKVHRLNFDLSGFDPKNIQVSIKDHILTIKAKQGKEETTNQNLICYKDYYFEYTLPKEVILDQIRSHHKPDGILTIEAPLIEKNENNSTVEIPIEKN